MSQVIPVDARLVAALRILLQFIQEFGLDPFPGPLRYVDHFPGLVESPVPFVESEQGIGDRYFRAAASITANAPRRPGDSIRPRRRRGLFHPLASPLRPGRPGGRGGRERYNPEC